MPHIVPARVEAATVAREDRWGRPARIEVEGADVDGDRLALALRLDGLMSAADDDVAVTVGGGEGEPVGIDLAVCLAAAMALGRAGDDLARACLVGDVVGRGPAVAIPDALEPTDDMSALWGMTVALPNCSDKSEDADPKVASDVAEAGLVRVQVLFQLLDIGDPDPGFALDGGAGRREAVLAARRAARERLPAHPGPAGPDGPGGDAR